MAYTAANLSMTSVGPLTGGGQRWRHESADATAAVDTAGFITDGGSRGVKVGDIVEHRDTGTGVITSHRVVSVSATYPGAVDLGDGTVIGATTNTD